MKVIGGQGHMSEKAQNSLFPQCKTLTGSNSSFTEDRAVKFGCRVGFFSMLDRIG